MASDIVSEAREIARLVASLKKKPDQKKGTELVERVNRLKNTLTRVVTPKARARALQNTFPADRLKRRAALIQIEPLADGPPAEEQTAKTGQITKKPPDEPEDMGIETFFEDVTNSLVNTQKRLNEVSLDYVRDLDPRIAPAYFAIPSLKAELKAGFQSTDDKKLSLVLFSSKKERKEYGESTVSFELAAAPPPPGEAPFGELSVPTPRYLVLGQSKRRLLAAARSIVQAQPGGRALGKTFTNTEESGLAQVLRFEPEADDKAAKRERYLVVWPSQTAATKNQHLWQELVVLPLVEDGAGVKLDPESPFTMPLRIARGKAPAGDPVAAVTDLGHALNRVALAIRDGSPAKRLTDALP